MKNIIDEIVDKISTTYNGKLDCAEERVDLFVYINGNEESIKSIDTKMIHFEDETLDVDFYDTDIHHLAYINAVI